jgi:hypothetical protein
MGHIHKGLSKNSIAREAFRGKMPGKKQGTHSEYGNGIKAPRCRRADMRRMCRTSNRTARKTIWLEIKRWIIRSVGGREMNNSAFWKVHPLPKRKVILSPA